MSHGARRPFVLLLLLLSLSLPLAAQPHRNDAGGDITDFLALLWNRLTASLPAVRGHDLATLPDGTEGTPAPKPETTPPPVLDGRSVIDPLG